MKPFVSLEEGLEKYRQIRNVIKSGLQQHIWLVGIYREFIESNADGMVLLSFNILLKFLLSFGNSDEAFRRRQNRTFLL